MSQEEKAANLVKWLVDEQKVNRNKAYYIAMHKFGLKRINGVRKEYQKIKNVVKNQLTLL